MTASTRTPARTTAPKAPKRDCMVPVLTFNVGPG